MADTANIPDIVWIKNDKKNYILIAELLHANIPIVNDFTTLTLVKKDNPLIKKVFIYNIIPEAVHAYLLNTEFSDSTITVWATNKNIYKAWTSKLIQKSLTIKIRINFSVLDQFPNLTGNTVPAAINTRGSVNYFLRNAIGPIRTVEDTAEIIKARLDSLKALYDININNPDLKTQLKVFRFPIPNEILGFTTRIPNLDYDIRVVVCLSDGIEFVRAAVKYSILFVIEYNNKEWRAKVHTCLPMELDVYNAIVSSNPKIVKCFAKKNNVYCIQYAEDFKPEKLSDIVLNF